MLKEILAGGVKLLGGKVREAAVEILGGSNIDPAKQLEFDARLREIEAEEANTMTKAAESVLLAEAKSEDGFVRRSRPAFLWLMYLILTYSFIVRPAMGLAPIDLPSDVYYLFGAGFLGYAGARSWDKKR